MKNQLWAVYKMTIRGNPDGMNAVCEQDEWEAQCKAAHEAWLTSPETQDAMRRGPTYASVNPRHWTHPVPR